MSQRGYRCRILSRNHFLFMYPCKPVSTIQIQIQIAAQPRNRYLNFEYEPKPSNMPHLPKEREVVIDIETCGNNNGVGRILEVTAVELIRGKKIGKKLHFYCNPGYSSDEDDGLYVLS
jgi:hypothetical protein